MKQLFAGLIAIFSSFLFTSSASAYPHFIGHGYPSCLNCHFNPMGNGPLTDYGRAVGADLVSSGMFYPKDWSDEKVASLSGFLFRTPLQDHIRTQVNYRGLYLVQGPGTAVEKKQWINMQADAQLILKFLEDDKLTFVGNFGYAPPSQPIPGEDPDKKFRSREYYAGYRFSPQFGVYAGFMDKAYGIRVAEHIDYSRVIPQVTMNDQTHGVMAHFVNEDWEIAAHGFVGNLQQASNLRQKGFSTMVEHSLSEIHRVGFSMMKTSGEYLSLLSGALHARFSLKEGSALLFEVGQTRKTTQNGAGDRNSRYGLLQTYLRPLRGLYVLANVEYLKGDVSSDSTTVRWGPGVQFFPVQKLELRLDINDTRNFDPQRSTIDSWMILLQTHVWL
jgi:hypothetical protein